MEMTASKPWYKQFYPWMIIAIPFLTVVGCIITITLAVTSPNALVKDNYYKEGLAINRDKERLSHAEKLNLQGFLRGDRHQLSLVLQGDLEQWPETLDMYFSHATREELDRNVIMHKIAAGQYASDWQQLPDGAWYYHLMPADKSWELRDRFFVSDVFQVRLSSQQ